LVGIPTGLLTAILPRCQLEIDSDATHDEVERVSTSHDEHGQNDESGENGEREVG
jgi:hypothetical protein